MKEKLQQWIEQEKYFEGFKWLWYFFLCNLVFWFWIWAITSDS